MIHHVTGRLLEIHDDSLVVEREGLGFVVAIPQYAVPELATRLGREVTLQTLLLVEGGKNGTHLEPRLVGFPDALDKLFFRRFVSVKGIGWRKALKALTVPIGQVAGWIERGDVTALKRLPGIGGRAAELIVAELKGKMKDLVLTGADERSVNAARFSREQCDALEIMVSIGDARADAERWLDRAAQWPNDIQTADEWLRAAYRIKAGLSSE